MAPPRFAFSDFIQPNRPKAIPPKEDRKDAATIAVYFCLRDIAVYVKLSQ